MTGQELNKAYQKGDLNGWLETRRPGLAKEQFNLLSNNFSQPKFFQNYDKYKDSKALLYLITRKVLGQDTANYPQLIGDCVSFGAKNAVEYVTCCQKFNKNEKLIYKPVFPPYFYGTGRIYIGREENSYEDGSLGSWMALAVQQFGTLFVADPEVPKYSAQVAKEFGAKRALLDKYKPIAIDNPVKRVIQIKTWQDLVVALNNGIPCTTASNIGYNMEPSSDGFHRQTTNWAHQMVIIGVKDDSKDPYALILNSWGDSHGRLKDFDDGHTLPIGVLRVRRKDIEKHLRENETFGFADFIGEKERRIDFSDFKLI